jgi:hypothetical protein
MKYKLSKYLEFPFCLLAIITVNFCGESPSRAQGSQAGDGSEPYSVAEARVTLAYAKLSQIADSLGRLGSCIDKQTKSHISNLQSGIAQSEGAFQSESRAYKLFVSKPMQGDGRCNGGFEAVASESGSRAERARAANAHLGNIQGLFSSLISEEFLRAPWKVDGTKDVKCALEAAKLDTGLDSAQIDLKSSLGKARESLGRDAAHFSAYQMQNNKLAASCGSEGNQSPLSSAAHEKARSRQQGSVPAPRGSDQPAESQVTGHAEKPLPSSSP